MTPSSSTSARLLPAAYRPVLAHRRFRRLLPALAASDLGDGMSVVAVAWLAIVIAPAGRSSLLLGAAVAAYTLPGVAGALAFGRWLRRMPARWLLLTHCGLRAVLLGCVPLAFAAGLLRPVLYVALLAGSSVLQAWGGAGKYALLAEMLPQDRRLAANALVGATSSASFVIGPALAGLLVTTMSPAWIIGLDAVSFALLALQVGRLRGSGPVPAVAPERTQVTTQVTEPATAPAVGAPADAALPGQAPADVPARSAAGLRLLRSRPELLGILVLTWLFYLIYGPVEVALPLHVTEDLHAGPGLLGLYWALFGVGAVLGGLTAGALRRLPLWPVTLGIVAGWGAILVPFGFGAPAAVSVTCFALGGAIYGPFTALSYTLFQGRTPATWLTTVLAARTTALLTATPVGTALGGPLTAALGPRQVLAGSGFATLLVAAAATAVRLWRRRRGPIP